MHGWSPVSLAQETTAVMLLVHTVAIVLYLWVASILLKALLRLRQMGERPSGFLAIAVLIFLTSVGRAAWMGMLWLNLLPPPWLDLLILSLVFAGVMGTPIILSAFYLPEPVAQRPRHDLSIWLHWAMIVNAIAGATTLFVGFLRGNLSLIYFGTPAVCTLAMLFLCVRVALLRNLQARRRGLVLFAAFTSGGLLTIASVLVYGAVHHMLVRRSTGTATLLEFSSLLIVIGMLFVFANLRLADVIVKRVLRISLWLCAALAVWTASTSFVQIGPFATDIRPQAVRYLVSVALIALFGAASPTCLRLLDTWIDRWLFQQPDFDAAISILWNRIVTLETEVEVFNVAAEIVRETLSLSAVRILSMPEAGHTPEEGTTNRAPGGLSSLAGSTDVRIPVFLEGSAKHWICLSSGVMRPPFTAMELGFVERTAARVQVRLQTMLAEERRIENVRREAAFNEELTDAELRALRAQINPHFLFNSLNTIADLTVTAPERAEQMTLRLSAVFRYVLVNTDKQFASLKEEINFARSYLAIEEFRFGDRLQTRIEVEPGLLEERVPTLLLQPLIENALKHGLAPRRSGGTISIVVNRTGTGIMLMVADNGIGLRSDSGSITPQNTHVGLSNVRKRLATAYQDSASFCLQPREGGGTEAVVVIEKGSRGHEGIDRR